MSAPFDWQAGRASREREVVYSLAALVAAGSGSGVDDGLPPGIGISSSESVGLGGTTRCKKLRQVSRQRSQGPRSYGYGTVTVYTNKSRATGTCHHASFLTWHGQSGSRVGVDTYLSRCRHGRAGTCKGKYVGL